MRTISGNIPPLVERMILSAELWLHAVEQFGERRVANRVTPTCRLNATAHLVPASGSVVVQQVAAG